MMSARDGLPTLWALSAKVTRLTNSWHLSKLVGAKAQAIEVVFGSSSRWWVDAAILVSTFTSAHGVMWMVSSLTRVMSGEGSLLSILGRRDAAWGMPIACVSFVVVLSGCVCLLDDFSTIVSLFSFFIWVFYGMMALALFRLRARGPAAQGT